jgi:hypothetical protein
VRDECDGTYIWKRHADADDDDDDQGDEENIRNLSF